MNPESAEIIYITKDGVDLGGFDLAGINEGLTSGYFVPDDLAWKEGMPEWIRLADVLNPPVVDPAPKAKVKAKITPLESPSAPVPRPATEKQIAYIKDLGGKARAHMTIAEASTMIEFLLNDPKEIERREKKQEREERQHERHASYFAHKERDAAKAAVEMCQDPEELKDLTAQLNEAEDNRLRFWEATFSTDAFEGDETFRLFDGHGDRFAQPVPQHIRIVLAQLDAELGEKWEMKEAVLFYERLERLYPQLVRRR